MKRFGIVEREGRVCFEHVKLEQAHAFLRDAGLAEGDYSIWSNADDSKHGQIIETPNGWFASWWQHAPKQRVPSFDAKRLRPTDAA